MRVLKDRTAAKGFGLIEALVATTLIAVAVFALYTGITSSFFHIRMARENLRATQVILEKMEVIRLLTWSQINQPGFLPRTFVAPYDPDATNSNKGLIYSGSLLVTNAPLAVDYADDMRMVVVTLSWETRGLRRNRELTTYVSRHGVQNYLLD